MTNHIKHCTEIKNNLGNKNKKIFFKNNKIPSTQK